MILYVNGDSYTEHHDDFSVYPIFLHKKLNGSLINRAVRGSSNDRLYRSTIEDIIKLKRTQRQNIFVLLALSFVGREELWAPESTDKDVVERFQNGDPNCRLVTREYLDRSQLTDKQVEEFVEEDVNTMWARFYSRFFMFVNTLENLNVPYFIFSGAPNENSMTNLNYIFGTEMYQILEKKKNILNIFDLSIPKWAKENNIPTKSTGHLIDSEGHEKFADYLYNQHLKEIWKEYVV